jgi:intein/homing endonuclease
VGLLEEANAELTARTRRREIARRQVTSRRDVARRTQRRPARRDDSADPLSIDDWAAYFTFGGLAYPLIQTTMGGVDKERIPVTAIVAEETNSAVFALILARLQAFSQVRFQWTRMKGSVPGDLWGTPDLKILETPWKNGSTAGLLARMEMDNSIAGNAYIARPRRDKLTRLRPDRVTIVLGSQTDADYPADAPDVEVAGYFYMPRSGRGQLFFPEQVAHFAPIPDPTFQFLGQSWLTPCITEVGADSLAIEHKFRFFENSAPESLDSLLLTPTGWIRMGDVRLGDRVIGSDGKPHHVIGVFPQGEQDMYRVTFSGGAQVECTYDHLWHVASVYDRRRGTHRVLSLREMIEGSGSYGAGVTAGTGGLHYPSGPAKWSVPLVEPVQFDDPGPLPVAPYLLGCLLGDGCLRNNQISLAAHTDDVPATERLIRPLLPAGVTLRHRDRPGTLSSEFYFGGGGSHAPNALRAGIRQLCLDGKGAPDKWIPSLYLRASISDRVAMLQGLLDTDGSVNIRQPNLVTFTSTSQRLSADLADLVGGLGGVATVKAVPGRLVGGKMARPQWHVTVKHLPEWIIPFRLPRKAGRYQPPSWRAGRWRYITAVEHIGRKPAQCIRVDTPDSLYVTDGFVLTHNTPNLAIKFDPSVPIETLRTFRDEFENEHRGAYNAYRCVTADAEVALWDGRRVRADQVRDGDMLVAWADGQPVPGMVAGTQWQPPSPVVTVRTQRGRVLRSTRQHPYLARVVSGRLGDPPARERWVAAADLKRGDLLRAGLGWAGDLGRADRCTIHEAWTLGLITGDGCTTMTTPTISAWDAGTRARLAAGYQLRHTGKGHDYRVLKVVGLCRANGLMGKRAWEKRIPVAIMLATPKIQGAFLAGLIDADGHVTDPAVRASAEIGITSTSLDLLRDAQHLLAGLGINASVSHCATGAGRKHITWRLHIHGNDQAAILAGVADLACEAKAARLADYASRGSLQRRSLYDRVTSVETGPEEPTIAIEVADYHTHVTGGLVTHNTLFLGGGADPVMVGKDFQQLDFAATIGKGEPLALDTPVATVGGWTTMGGIQPGMRVFGRAGQPVNVVAVGPVHHQRPCYRITLQTGESIVADAGHQWPVMDRTNSPYILRTWTTEELYRRCLKRNANGATGYSLLPPPVLELPELDFLIDPYVLGAWLGDGDTAGPAVTGHLADLKHIRAEVEARGYTTSMWGSRRGTQRCHMSENVGVMGMPGGLLSALDAIGVLGDKHIPGIYLRGSAAQRLDLLRGLMDTDGGVGRNGQGQCEYSSKDEALARQVLELVRSLGYRPSLVGKPDSRSRTGYQWRVRFRVRPDCIPFLLPRKVDLCMAAGEPHFSMLRPVASVEPVESVPVRCITVDSPDHLFLAGDGFVPTHNSRLAAAAGVAPSWVGFSEGLQGSSLNAGNFQAARRRFSDGPQPLDARVLTPLGWRQMGEMGTGTPVIGVDGQTHQVLATFDQGAQDVYQVDFIDGSSVQCSAGHLWTVRDGERRRRGWETLPLGQIMETGFRKGERPPRWAVPLPEAVEFPARPLPVDPYLLGMLLGDGTFVPPVRISCAWGDVEETGARLQPRLPAGVSSHICRGAGCAVISLTGTAGRAGRTMRRTEAIMPGLLDQLGLHKVTCKDKFIPRIYLNCPAKERVALLQGLMDSDGMVTAEGTLRFSSSSPQLLADVAELVASLGGMAFLRGSAWDELAISRLPEWIIPVRLLRKRARLTTKTWTRVKSMTGAQLVRHVPTRCIKTSGPGGLYLTDGYTVTHNTMWHLWQVAATSLETICPPPPGAHLWPDTRIPFMRDNATDIAAIQAQEATTLNTLVTAGYTPESAVAAVQNNDLSLLVHTGLTSVQLLPPGKTSSDSAAPDPAAVEDPGDGAQVALPAGSGNGNGTGAGS